MTSFDGFLCYLKDPPVFEVDELKLGEMVRTTNFVV